MLVNGSKLHLFPSLMTSLVLLLFVGLPAQYSMALTAAMRGSIHFADSEKNRGTNLFLELALLKTIS